VPRELTEGSDFWGTDTAERGVKKSDFSKKLVPKNWGIGFLGWILLFLSKERHKECTQDQINEHINKTPYSFRHGIASDTEFNTNIYKSKNEADLEIEGKILESNKNKALRKYHFQIDENLTYPNTYLLIPLSIDYINGINSKANHFINFTFIF
jgi:hypothetical protein